MSFLSAIQLCESATFRGLVATAGPYEPMVGGSESTGFPEVVKIVHEGEPRGVLFASRNVLAVNEPSVNLHLAKFEDILVVTRESACGMLEYLPPPYVDFRSQLTGSCTHRNKGLG